MNSAIQIIFAALILASQFSPLESVHGWLERHKFKPEWVECRQSREDENTYFCAVWLDIRKNPDIYLEVTPGSVTRKYRVYRIQDK